MPRKTPQVNPADPAAESTLEELVGNVESVVFRSEDTGYTVCRVAVDGLAEAVSLVGKCPAIWVGESLRAKGRWTQHKQHGRQFQADSMLCIVPTSARGIERYLASGMIRGIGKTMAKRIVDYFGESSIDIIDKESIRLEEVEGIGPVRRQLIKESWTEQRAVRDIMIFLQSHGVGTAQSARIYRHFGANAIAVITDNPYKLSDVWGIGFKTADAVARSIGIPIQSEKRAKAGIVYVLQTLTEEGHCFAPLPELLLEAENILQIPIELLKAALDSELERGALIKDRDRIYLPDLHAAEINVAHRVARIAATPASFPPILVDKAVPWAADRMKLKFAPMQEQALRTAMANKISIITGGPGVGKTTIIRALVEVFSARKLRVLLAAPTGRAAKRMEEATQRSAATLHRLLKYLPQAGNFEHGPHNPIEGDVFILDEVSMMDLPLMNHFLSAVPNHGCLVLVGDIDQLPSVGPGNVLKDFIESGVLPCVKLETIFRQESGGWIVRNAHHVNQGEYIELPSRGETADFYFLQEEDPDKLLDKVVDLVTSSIPRRFRFDPMTEIQVLSPMRRNQLGADNLNAVLQKAMNPAGAEIQRFGRFYRTGDRIMQIRNNYDKTVFNGDIGRIRSVDNEDQSLVVDFDGRTVSYDFSEVDELVHAYACTIHKSQGSEYPAVVILLTTQHYKMLQRNLLYTAITRGRKLVCLAGTAKAVRMAIHNNQIRLRRAALRERIIEQLTKP